MSPSQYGGYDPRLVTKWVWLRIPSSRVDKYSSAELAVMHLTYEAADRNTLFNNTSKNVSITGLLLIPVMHRRLRGNGYFERSTMNTEQSMRRK
ncbi:hypothetical protein TNCV_4676701 [Trichonephila clavipes]|nr:hypothetical protein TNCV_4676701 [Trichonephila clavipes]